MAPPINSIPYLSNEYKSAEDYVESLLNFCSTSLLFQSLCSKVHILDFYTRELSTFRVVIPLEWQEWLLSRDMMELLNFLMRDDLGSMEIEAGEVGRNQSKESAPPKTLISYVKEIRRLSLNREISLQRRKRQSKSMERASLSHHVKVGMVPKKIHEVENFARYLDQLADDIANDSGEEITHFIDIGCGQNYLGRTLASPPYNKQVVAIENREANIKSAKYMDVSARIAKREIVMRNKKLYRYQQIISKSDESIRPKERKRIEESQRNQTAPALTPVDLRPSRELDTIYIQQIGKGYIQYVHHELKSGCLENVINHIEQRKMPKNPLGSNPTTGVSMEKMHVESGMTSPDRDTKAMVVSIHSCGNLSHHGIQSLLHNRKVHAVAVIGCCYNCLSERFNSLSVKQPLLHSNESSMSKTQVIDNKVANYSDPHGFPMSERVATHGEVGLRLNITARMMAVQAPYNWTEKESDHFFTRNFYRALLQRIFVDRDIVKPRSHIELEGQALPSTEPVIIGTLPKKCYQNFRTYVRGAIEKLESHDPMLTGRGAEISQKMKDITDQQIDDYLERYQPLKKELSVTWSLMAFSAVVLESLIVIDRWLFLREHTDIVQDSWVEPVFDHRISPRNLVVVGIKR